MNLWDLLKSTTNAAADVPPLSWLLGWISAFWNTDAMQSVRGWQIWDGVGWVWSHTIGWAYGSTFGNDVVWSKGTAFWLPTMFGLAAGLVLLIWLSGSWIRGHQVNYSALGSRYMPGPDGVTVPEDPSKRVLREKPIDRDKSIVRSQTWKTVLLPLYLLCAMLAYGQWTHFSADAYFSLVMNLWLLAPLMTLLVIYGARRAYRQRYLLYKNTDDELPPLTGSFLTDVRGYYTTMLTFRQTDSKTNADRQPPVAGSNIGYRSYNWLWRNFWIGGVVWKSIRINPLLLAYVIVAQRVVSGFGFLTLCVLHYRHMQRAEDANGIGEDGDGIGSGLLFFMDKRYQLKTGPRLRREFVDAIAEDGQSERKLVVIRDADGNALLADSERMYRF